MKQQFELLIRLIVENLNNLSNVHWMLFGYNFQEWKFIRTLSREESSPFSKQKSIFTTKKMLRKQLLNKLVVYEGYYY